MSKGLEALENICNQCEHYQFEKGLRPKKCPFNKSCVFKQQIEKELKALEIIKEKKVDIHTLFRDSNIIGDTFDYYNNSMLINRGVQYELTQEEYDLLKEVLL